MSFLPLSSQWLTWCESGLLMGAMAMAWTWAVGCSSSKPAQPSAGTPGVDQDDPRLEFDRYTLPNGLTVILHQDARLPVVAVDLWYRVGSFNEPPGRSGFAHLFEHLMFQGSRHVPDDGHFRMLEEAGASDINGTTDFDRTNYFVTVPREELPLALWLESDRMGYLLDTLAARKLDNQRAVVKNEKRQSFDGAPYGLAYLSLFHALFPEGHPYRYTPIGRFEDLDAASLEDVRQFFRTYYAPANATLAVAGDFDPAVIRPLILQAFGGFPSGVRPPTPKVTTPEIAGEVRQVVEETVAPLAKVTIAWLTPSFLAPGDADLDVLGTILASGKASRLYQTLVDKAQLAQSVEAGQQSLAVTGIFTLDAVVAPGKTAEEVERALDAVIAEMATTGPDADEVLRARRRIELGMLRGLEKVGGLEGRAEILQTYHHATGDPSFLAKHLAQYRAVTPQSIRDAVRRYLRRDARVVQHAIPKVPLVPSSEDSAAPPPEKSTEPTPSLAPADAWRAQPPAPLSGTTLVLPVPQHAQLENGLTVLAVHQPALPVVSMMLVTRRGSAQDDVGLEGRSALAAQMLTEGMEGMDSAALANAFADLGTEISAAGGLEATTVSTVVHRRHRDSALQLLARTILAPTMEPGAFERLRTRMVTHLDERLHDPMGVAMHLASRVALGLHHPYGRPREGTPDGLKAVTLEGVKDLHARQWTAATMALVVAGDVTLEEAVSMARTHLGSLPRGVPPPSPPPPPAHRTRETIWAVHLANAPQAVVLAATPGLSAHDPDTPALTLLNSVLGGNFSSRLNMNLREEKGVTYGVFSAAQPMRNGGLVVVGSPVQADAVGLATTETLRELEGLVSQPVTPEELTLAKQSNSRSLPADFESLSVTTGAMARLFALDLPLNHYAQLPARFSAVTPADQARLAGRVLNVAQVQLLLVGDRTVLEKGMAEVGLGPIRWMDAQGHPLPPGPGPGQRTK